ncbi:phosphotransferase [Lewinella sp. W8]|uniref:phosphotransferase n=1 Tax=Lewinella sp. W8 TaxID=2528208 RepID=UPI001565813B|nr:phosphotransferase [Lewinella sp. W8]
MATDAQRFEAATNSSWFLEQDDRNRLQAYLKHIDYLLPNERIMAAPSAGEGNMNLTLRVFTDRRHFILKQSRPWVAKFPDIPAPVERIHVERDFLMSISRDRFLESHSPELLRADSANYVLLMEDVGDASDLSAIYREGETLAEQDLKTLTTYAATLHQLCPMGYPENRPLRELNHAHIFDLPFRPDNGFPLEAIHPGLADVARPFQHDQRLRNRATALGERYLSPGPCLLHGDYYPGSFLRIDDRLTIIDAEFSFCGTPEFDLGVLRAHLLLAQTPPPLLEVIRREYTPVTQDFSWELVEDFCNVEIMRRLIGIAQLPLELSLEERQQMLERARAGLV